MAILSKIRERSMFLIVIIGLALFSFVASPKDILDFFNSSKVNTVGEVNGEQISKKEFTTQVEAYKSNAGNGVTEMQAVNAVWNSILSEKIFKSQLEESGIVVGEKDVWDAIVEIPSIKNAELFKNEIGLFDEEKLKNYLADLKENSKDQANNAWLNWLQTERSVASNIERAAYSQLVKLGVGASLKEGERAYLENQTKLSGKYVYVPYSSINDSLVSITSDEVASYVKEHASDYETDATRDISYVTFDIKASSEDEAAIKDDLNFIVPAFVKTETVDEFIEDNGTDIPVDANFVYKNNLPTVIADEAFSAAIGNVVGPYKFQNHLRLSKIVASSKMPDSVKASHILIAFAGSRAADATVTRTEAQAEQLADSILKVVTKRSSKFASLAKTISVDKSNASKGGDLGWFTYNAMVPEFRDYSFENSKGDIGVVKTTFGFHVIKIEDQKNIQKVLKLATIAKKIDASEATENTIFEQAETLAYEISLGKNIDVLAKENNYIARPLVGVKEMDDAVGALGKNRGVVRWAFDNETAVNSVKRFDLEKGYAVVVVTNKSDKGLVSVAAAASKVKPILLKEKKAALIAAKMVGADLPAIATASKVSVASFTNVTMGAPTISGVGTEPAVVGAIYATKLNTVINTVNGNKGVFAVVTTKKELPTTLPNYEGSRASLATDNQSKLSSQLYNSLKDISEVTDNRALLY
jgi:peptidyl-prolyl cis-trans isomerase D